MEILQGVRCTPPDRTELTTPTGAAIISHLAREFGPLPEIQVEAAAYGLGDKDLEIPNLLRIIKGQRTPRSSIWLLECNIDDMNTQFYSYILPLLMEEGAMDVYLTPDNEKNRRHCLSVLCDESSLDRLEAVLWKETSTLKCAGSGGKAVLERNCSRSYPLGNSGGESSLLSGPKVKYTPRFGGSPGSSSCLYLKYKEVQLTLSIG